MSDETQNTPETGQTELSQLDMIGIEAAQDEAEAQAAQDAILNPQQEQAQVMPPAVAWSQIPMTIGVFLSSMMPELQGVFNESACANWGAAMASVSEKYGWSAEDTMAKWAPELALGMATLPLAVPVYKAVKSRKEEKEKEKKRENTQVSQAPAPVPENGGFGESAG